MPGVIGVLAIVAHHDFHDFVNGIGGEALGHIGGATVTCQNSTKIENDGVNLPPCLG